MARAVTKKRLLPTARDVGSDQLLGVHQAFRYLGCMFSGSGSPSADWRRFCLRVEDVAAKLEAGPKDRWVSGALAVARLPPGLPLPRP